MAERSVAVRLSARVDQYVAAMNKAKSATGELSRQSQRNLSRVGSQMQSFGRAATLGVTVPLVGLGGAAVGMASQFESAFARMEGLAGVPQSEIDSLRDSVLGLAGETGRPPQELAEALYFLRSSGLDGAEALDALEQSARASAAGMGSTAVIADAVSSAMNAYSASGLDAAEATDILVATARAGKAEPAELAGALGRVLPIASELGVSFEDVGGAIAAFSLTGNSASDSVTLLSNVLLKLLKPSQQGAQALADVGLSTDAIRASIAEDGLLATLEMLKGRLGDAGFVKFLEDAQAVTGALSLTGENAAGVAATFENVRNNAGATGDAFSAMADSDAFKMQQAMANLQVAMIELGTVLLPVVANIASSIADLVSWFTDLPGPVQSAVGAFAALAAAGGPMLIVAGSLVKNFGLVSTALSKMPGPVGVAARGLTGIAVVAGVAYEAWQILGEGHLNASAHINTASTALQTETQAAYDAAVAAGEAVTATEALALAHIALSNAIKQASDEAGGELTQAMAALNVTSDEWLDTLLTLGTASPNLESLTLEVDLAMRAFGRSRDEMEMLVDELHFGTHSVDELAAAFGLAPEALHSFNDGLFVARGYAIENKDEVNALALAYLDWASSVPGATSAALEAAEAIAGSRQEAGNAVPVYEEFLRQLIALGPAAEGAVEEMGEIPGVFHEIASLPQSEEAPWASSKWIDGVRTLTTETKALGEAVEKVAFGGKQSPFGEMFGEGLNDLLSSVPERISRALDELRSAASASTFAGALGGMVGELEGVEGAADDARASFQELQGAVDTLIDTFNNLTGPEDRVREATRGVYEEVEQTAEALANASNEGLTLAEAFDVSTETGRANQRQLEEHRDAIYEHALALMENGASATEAAGDIAWNTNALRENMLQAGYTEAEVDALIDTYFATPEEVETQLRLIGAAMAAAEIATHKTRLGSIPTGISSRVHVSSSGVSTVAAQLAALARNIYVKVYVEPTGLHGRAAGGPVAAGTPYVVGETGRELFVPEQNGHIVNASQTAALLAGTHALSGNLRAAPSATTYITQMDVDVHLPPGSDGADVVRELQKYQRRNGPLALRIAGVN